jgi:AsmA protein
MTKKLLIAGMALALIIIVVIAAVALLFDANQFRPQLEAAMGEALGRRVSIGNIRTALLSGGIALDDLTIADDPAFSKAPFVTAKSVSVGVDLMPLIVSRTLRVETFRLEEPQVTLISSSSGQWNFSGLGGPPSSGAPPSSSTTPSMATTALVQKIAIANGRIVVLEAGQPNAKERAYESVNLEASNLSFTSQFPFHLTAKAPGGGTVALDGQAGPFNTIDAAETPFQATVDIADLDAAATGVVDATSGIAGRISFKGSMTSDGERVTSKGTVNATGVQLVPAGSPARVPMQIVYESAYNRKAQTGAVTQGDVHIGNAVAHLVGDFNAAGDTVGVRFRLTATKMAAAALEATLPAIGVTLPSGASLKQGTLDMNLTISGPVDRVVIAGPIGLANVTIAGFDLGGKLSALPSLGGVPGRGDTVIQTLAANVRVAPDGIQANGVNVVAASIGTLTGAGTIAPGGAMNFKMTANSIPFLVQGTTASPVFKPDLGGALTSLVRNPDAAKKAASTLGDLFRKKR